MINYTKAASYKKCNSLFITAFGTSYLFVRDYCNDRKWFNIAKCEVNTDGHVDENDGLISDAIRVHAEEVAYLLAESEAREEQLRKVESLSKELIGLRRARSRKAKHRPHQLQRKKEAII